jgi:short-subunit dehydrogenase
MKAVAEQCLERGASTVQCVEIDLLELDHLESTLMSLDTALPVTNLIISGCTTGAALLGRKSRNHYQLNDVWKSLKGLTQFNLVSAIATFEPLVTRFIQREGGQIVFVSSPSGNLYILLIKLEFSGFIDNPNCPAYSMTMRALISLALCLRPILARHNIKVNVVCSAHISSELDFELRIPFISSAIMKTGLFNNATFATDVIYNGLQQNLDIVAVPWFTATLFKLFSVLPYSLRSYIFNCLWRSGLSLPSDEIVPCDMSHRFKTVKSKQLG